MNALSKRLISLALVAAVVAACSSTPTGRSQLTLKSEAALAAEGTRQMAVIRENSPLVQDRATIDYVACIADAIVGVLQKLGKIFTSFLLMASRYLRALKRFASGSVPMAVTYCTSTRCDAPKAWQERLR